jgi:hypothetical protein
VEFSPVGAKSLGREVGMSAFRPCGRDLVEFFNCTGWAFLVNLTSNSPTSGLSLALIGDVLARKRFGADSRDFFDKGTRRKPLAFAVDAAIDRI